MSLEHLSSIITLSNQFRATVYFVWGVRFSDKCCSIALSIQTAIKPIVVTLLGYVNMGNYVSVCTKVTN